MKSVYLFDLDGTLTDPKQGITKSVAYALSKFDIHVSHLDDLCIFIGPPLLDSFMEYYHMSKEDAEKAITYYREYFSVTGLFENEVYEGITKLLQTLKDQGKKFYVATSKPEIFAKQIMEHFQLGEYFEDICGASMDSTRSKKGDVIAYALKNMAFKKKMLSWLVIVNMISLAQKKMDYLVLRFYMAMVTKQNLKKPAQM